MTSSPGSGRNWTSKDLAAFNIRVADATASAFFANSELPESTVPTTALENLHKPRGRVREDARLFFDYLMLTERATSEEYAVDDLTGYLLRMLQYDRVDGPSIIQLKKDFSFFAARERIDVEMDFHIERSSYLASLPNEQRIQAAEPQIIAGLIAAYYQNNLQRAHEGLPALPLIVMPGITTAPVFYHIPVSPQLLEALATSTCPEEETVVLRFIPPVAGLDAYFSDGMLNLDNRLVIFQCFEAVKKSQMATPQA